MNNQPMTIQEARMFFQEDIDFAAQKLDCDTAHERDVLAQLAANAWTAGRGVRDEVGTLKAAARELLGKAFARYDSPEWFWRCRHCDGRSPYVGLRDQAKIEDVEHKADCVVARMQEMTQD